MPRHWAFLGKCLIATWKSTLKWPFLRMSSQVIENLMEVEISMPTMTTVFHFMSTLKNTSDVFVFFQEVKAIFTVGADEALETHQLGVDMATIKDGDLDLFIRAPCSHTIALTAGLLGRAELVCSACGFTYPTSSLVDAASDEMLRRLGSEPQSLDLNDVSQAECPWLDADTTQSFDEHGLLLSRGAVSASAAAAVRAAAARQHLGQPESPQSSSPCGGGARRSGGKSNRGDNPAAPLSAPRGATNRRDHSAARYRGGLMPVRS